ncbi:hypothetical protein GOODEAATRI_015346, partial [Goodea atripinnis]
HDLLSLHLHEFFGQESLCVLNVSNNNIEDIKELSVLKELQHFSAAKNKLLYIEEMEGVFELWPQLLVLDLSGNPVCKKNKYRDRLITVCRRLETLDGREINELTRQFLINWKASKEANKRRNNNEMSAWPVVTHPQTNDFDVGQGPHPGRIYRPVNKQGWEPQQPPRSILPSPQMDSGNCSGSVVDVDDSPASSPSSSPSPDGRRRGELHRSRTLQTGALGGRGRPAAANAARERSRVQTLRNAFLELQRTLPSVPPDTKLSKLDVLILATTYIAHLTRTLQEEGADEGESTKQTEALHSLKGRKRQNGRSLIQRREYNRSSPTTSLLSISTTTDAFCGSCASVFTMWLSKISCGDLEASQVQSCVCFQNEVIGCRIFRTTNRVLEYGTS